MESLRFYIAARLSSRQEVQEIYHKIREREHIISLDWIQIKDLDKPYNKNSTLAGRYAGKIIRAIKDSDIFIMLNDEKGTGTDMYGEIASAISFNLIYKKPEIFVMDMNKNISPSIFPFHPAVIHKKAIEEILNELESSSFLIRRKVIDNLLDAVEKIRRKS